MRYLHCKGGTKAVSVSKILLRPTNNVKMPYEYKQIYTNNLFSEQLITAPKNDNNNNIANYYVLFFYLHFSFRLTLILLFKRSSRGHLRIISKCFSNYHDNLYISPKKRKHKVKQTLVLSGCTKMLNSTS